MVVASPSLATLPTEPRRPVMRVPRPGTPPRRSTKGCGLPRRPRRKTCGSGVRQRDGTLSDRGGLRRVVEQRQTARWHGRRSVMPFGWLKALDAVEVAALYAFLKTLPPKQIAVRRRAPMRPRRLLYSISMRGLMAQSLASCVTRRLRREPTSAALSCGRIRVSWSPRCSNRVRGMTPAMAPEIM